MEGLSEGDTIYIASTVSAGIDEETLREAGGGEEEGESSGTEEGSGATDGGDLPQMDGQEFPDQIAMP